MAKNKIVRFNSGKMHSILTHPTASDSAKVTAALSCYIEDIDDLAINRNLSVFRVEQHLTDCEVSGVSEVKAVDTLISLMAFYTQAYFNRFRCQHGQPNLRAVLWQSIRKHGADRTRVLLDAFLLGASTQDQARIARFYKQFVSCK